MSEEIKKDSDNSKEDLANIEKKLVEADPKIFEGIPKPKRERIIRSLVVTMHKTHVGPLPDPETLAEYSEIIPDGAERIMKMAEKQLDHRLFMEKEVITGQMRQSNIGQFLAFFIGIAALTAATICIVNGFQWAGGIIGVGGLTGLVTAFLKGRSQQEKSITEKHPRSKK